MYSTNSLMSSKLSPGIPIKKYNLILKSRSIAFCITVKIFSSSKSLLITFLSFDIDSGARVIVLSPLLFKVFNVSYVIDSILREGVEI